MDRQANKVGVSDLLVACQAGGDALQCFAQSKDIAPELMSRKFQVLFEYQ